MQAQSSRSCIHCHSPWRANEMRYLLSDMNDEMQAWVELKLKYEVNEHGWLCEKCFTIFRSTWASIQESEVECELESMEIGLDPLTETKFLSEEVQIKSEEPKCIEHYDYKIEMDTSQPSTSIGEDSKGFQSNYENKSSEATAEESCDEKQAADEVEEKDSDYEPNKEESSSEDDSPQDKTFSQPLLLNGNSLKSGTKCDCCKTLLTKTQYRKLTDEHGSVKEYLVFSSNRRFDRKASPERICNPCWNKAHGAVIKQKVTVSKKTEKNVSNATDTSLITIPGYRRFSSCAHTCIIHGSKCSNLCLVPKYLKLLLLKSYNLYSPEGARICREYCKEYCRDWSFLKKQRFITTFKPEYVTGMLNLLRKEALKYPE